MSEKTECTCDLIDVSTHGEVRYVRGLSRGCTVHPPGEWEERQMQADAEARARYEALVAAAEKAAREAP